MDSLKNKSIEGFNFTVDKSEESTSDFTFPMHVFNAMVTLDCCMQLENFVEEAIKVGIEPDFIIKVKEGCEEYTETSTELLDTADDSKTTALMVFVLLLRAFHRKVVSELQNPEDKIRYLQGTIYGITDES